MNRFRLICWWILFLAGAGIICSCKQGNIAAKGSKPSAFQEIYLKESPTLDSVFNRSTEIQVIRYTLEQEEIRDRRDAGYDFGEITGESVLPPPSQIPWIDALTALQTGELSFSEGNKSIVLNKRFRNKLHRVIRTQSQIGFSEHSCCYKPRHLVLFKDEDGQAFAFIEICFECEEVESNIEDRALEFPVWSVYREFFEETGLGTE